MVEREGQLVEKAGGREIRVRWWWMGEDLVVAVEGGQAHVGAVAAALPRPSLADPARTSASVSSFCYPAHKDDEPARELARMLGAGLGVKVVVVAGMHWEGLDEDGIAQVMEAVGRVGQRMVQLLRR